METQKSQVPVVQAGSICKINSDIVPVCTWRLGRERDKETSRSFAYEHISVGTATDVMETGAQMAGREIGLRSSHSVT